MVVVADVCQFVDEDIVDQVGWELNRGPVDVHRAVKVARTPPVAK
jgi:hypothetical protein